MFSSKELDASLSTKYKPHLSFHINGTGKLFFFNTMPTIFFLIDNHNDYWYDKLQCLTLCSFLVVGVYDL